MSGKAWSEPAAYGRPEQIETEDGWRVGRCVCWDGLLSLFRVDVTGELLWVEAHNLQPYPASPIEQPKKRRTAKKARRK